MPKHTWSVTAAFLLCTLLLAACGGSTVSSTSSTPASNQSVNALHIKSGAFSSFVKVIQAGQAVVWTNDDTVAHRVTSTPKPGAIKGDKSKFAVDTTAFLNPATFDLTVPPGKSAGYFFNTPGLYHYYDPGFAAWSTDYSRVQANDNAPNFPMAMEGIIWVQGSIANLPASAKNGVLAATDDWLFDFVAVHKGGSVSFQNFDTDKHVFGLATGVPSPLNPAKQANPVTIIKGTDDAPPAGETVTFTFDTPGLYYYYCSTHADIDQASGRAKAHTDASAYPVPMEGFILVSDQ